MEEHSGPKFKGLFGGSQIRGAIDVDIAKSALQKAVRRGNFKLACAMAIRLNEFLNVEEGKGKAIRTNLINRLPVIAGEDIGMGNLWVVGKVQEYLEKYFHTSDLRQDEKLIECIGWMVLSEKSRQGSYVNAVFYQALSSPEYYPRLEQLCPGLIERMKDVEMRAENVSFHLVDLDNHILEECDSALLSRIFYLLKNSKDDIEKMSTFFYIRHLLNSKNKYKIKRGKTMRKISSEPIYFVWNKMLEINKDLVLRTLYEQFMSENERHIYIVLAMMVFYFGAEVERKKLNEDVKLLIEEHGGYNNLIRYSLEDDIEIPEYVVDKHTKKGRTKGKDSIVFAVEGAVVENESLWSKKWAVFQEIYVDFRKWCPSFKLENEYDEIVAVWTGRKKEKVKEKVSEFGFFVSGSLEKEKRISIMSDETIRGQLLTSVYKKYVYIPTDEKFVYKGPFDPINGTPKEREKLKTLSFRFQVCAYFRTMVLKGEILSDDKNCLWIRYPSLATSEICDWKTTTTFDKTSGKNIKVVDRKSMGILPVSYYSHEKDKITRYMFGKRGLYYDFLLLYVLGVGDTGLYNVLVADLAPMIIDIDDDTTKTEFTKDWSIFGKAPVPAVVEVIVEGVKENKSKIQSYLHGLKEGIPKILELAKMYGMNPDIFEKKIEQLVKYFS